ncbi:MAG TPA: GNAT family N-acetyltransferase [Dermatophilaceae bacterium]|jgi:N-acetylglutamate synthase-like GNAT family acetyltransferase|nr:GNAT family N-acetyltransferase [Dermatophilaceae bacterium]
MGPTLDLPCLRHIGVVVRAKMTVMHRIRRAVEADQRAITDMVRDARLNPRSLDWDRFVVAEADGELVGVAQMRQHPDGSQELASLVVQPSARGGGVASDLIDALLADRAGQVFMLVDRKFANHYQRWGFRPVAAAGLPRSVRRQYRIGQIVTGIGSLLLRRRIRLVPLRRA